MDRNGHIALFNLAITAFNDDTCPCGGFNIRITKSSADTSITSGSSAYSLAGAVYGIWSTSACSGTPLERITTNSSGVAQTAEPIYAPGKYYLKEITAPTGYELDTTVHTVTISSSGTITVNKAFTDTPKTGSITITKKSADPSVTDGNSQYKYNAVYGVYSNSACTTLVKQITLTNGTNQGTGTVTGLALGKTYYVKEISASAGFKISTAVSAGLKLTEASPTKSTVMTEPYELGSIWIVKKSSKTSVTDGNPNYKYDATYGVYSDSACTTLVKSVKLTSGTNQGTGTVTGLTLGTTYYIKEITNPAGFAKSATVTSANPTGATPVAVANVTETPREPNVTVFLTKKSSNPAATDGNDSYRYDATYGVYSDSACTNLIKTINFANGEDEGYAQITSGIALGSTVYLKEIEAPAGFKLSTTVTPATIPADSIKSILTTGNVAQGGVNSTTGGNTSSAARLRSGYIQLPAGKYVIRTTSAFRAVAMVYSSNTSDTYIKEESDYAWTDGTMHEFTLSGQRYVRILIKKADGTAVTPADFTWGYVAQPIEVELTDTPYVRAPYIRIEKRSSAPEITDNDSNYQYDATYGIYSDKACTELVNEQYKLWRCKYHIWFNNRKNILHQRNFRPGRF